MTSNYVYILFIYFIYIFSWQKTSASTLKFLFRLANNVVRCTKNEYLIFRDWEAFSSLHIGCANQAYLFENYPPDLIDELAVEVHCDGNNKQWRPFLKSFYIKTIGSGKVNQCLLPWPLSSSILPYLHGHINDTDFYYLFSTHCMGAQIVMDLGSQVFPTKPNEIRTLYMIFSNQPIVCRIRLNQSEFIRNGKCLFNATMIVNNICYYEPGDESAPIAPDWQLLEKFFTNSSLAPNNWITQPGYYYNALPHAISTVTPLTSPTGIVNGSTSNNKTNVTVLSTIGINTSTTTKVTTTTTTSTTSKTNSVTSATTHLNKSTPFFQPLNTYSTKKMPSQMKRILLLLIILVGVAVVSIVIYLYRQKQLRRVRSSLNRNNSDQTHKSAFNESERNSLGDKDEQASTLDEIADISIPTRLPMQSKIRTQPTTGRIVNKLDPDNL